MKRIFYTLSIAFLMVFALPALAADGTPPIIGIPSPNQAVAGTPVTITVVAADNDSGIASCNYYMDNNDEGPMTVGGGMATRSFTFAQAGVHTHFVFCRDNSGSMSSGANGSITVSAGSGDTIPPVIGQISPTTVVVGSSTIFQASVSDSGFGVANCKLVIDSFDRGSMSVSSGTASKEHTFDTAGTAAVYAQCFDGAGNSGLGPVAIVTISPPSSTQNPSSPPPSSPPPPPNVAARLIKISCPTGALANHPCHAVYYHGTDGKRHAFPNQKIFFTWYADFSTVQQIPASEMAGITLGANVTYRPGVKLVKFTTVNRTYAVAKGSVLRWITGENIARELYGMDWNKKVDDISDTFFGDYKFGADVSSVQNYSPSIELQNTLTISDNL